MLSLLQQAAVTARLSAPAPAAWSSARDCELLVGVVHVVRGFENHAAPATIQVDVLQAVLVPLSLVAAKKSSIESLVDQTKATSKAKDIRG